MLFIFRVDVGTMINLDMNLALETVAHLKSALASYCNIPVDKQVCWPFFLYIYLIYILKGLDYVFPV